MAQTKKAAGEAANTIEIEDLKTSSIRVQIIGTAPLILNSMSEKVWHELLAPRRKTAADKANNLKHDPRAEFRAAPYRIDDPKSPTLIGFMASAFKRAMSTAALRIPGVRKTEIAQLVYVPGHLINVYGIPKLFMSITRSADMNKTPDVRTRAIIENWAIELELTYVTPALNEKSIVNLLQAAGFICGVGDWRQEKGSGSYGGFRLVTSTDQAAFDRIKKTGGREAQIAALERAEPYDSDSAKTLSWFDDEMVRRGSEKSTASAGETKPPKATRPRKTNGNGHDAGLGAMN